MALITAFFLSGLYVLSTNMVREYHYVNSPKTWAGAQTFCREVYTDLATVESKEENIRLLLETQEPGKLAWIGLYDDTKSWMWTMGDGKFDRENSFFRWERNEPNNIGGKQSCVVMNWVGFWRDEICETDRPFVCPSKYILVDTFMTWDVARNYCLSKYTDLVTVRNLTENEKIHPMLARNVWIGLRRNFWTNWSDESLATFKNWYESQPDNSGSTPASCAAVDTTTGTWANFPQRTEEEDTR
uniref:C-type lectin domain-containing protein n=1 Tax=Kryptolebias marmoratus TaxID=37003 RepID=A0A3Q3EI78_KRYMA